RVRTQPVLSRLARAHRGLRQAPSVSLTRPRQFRYVGVNDGQTSPQIVLGQRFDVLVVESVVKTPPRGNVLDDLGIPTAFQAFGERLELVTRLVLESEVDGRRLAARHGDLDVGLEGGVGREGKLSSHGSASKRR